MAQTPQAFNTAERRAYPRNPIHLRAVCIVNGEAGFNCTIRDFCTGGLYLEYDQIPHQAYPAPGTLVTISCTVPSATSQTDLTLQARIARTTDKYSGVSFVNPDQYTLDILQEFADSRLARQQHDPAPGKTTVTINHTKTSSGSHQALIEACQKMVTDQAAVLAGNFLSDCAHHLKNRVNDEKDTSFLNTLFSAQEIFSESESIFPHRLQTTVKKNLSNFPISTPHTGAQEINRSPQSELKLMEDDVFDDWLTIIDLSSQAEMQNKQQLAELEQRLSVIYRTLVQQENNPFSPTLFAQSYLDALRELNIDRQVFHDCHIAFKQTLADYLGSLYDNLNQFLLEHHILPDLKLKLQKQVRPSPTGKAEPRPDNIEQQNITSNQITDTDQQQNFFALACDLKSLQQDVSQPAKTLETTRPVTYFSTEDVLSALSRLQPRSGQPDMRDYSTQVGELLSSRGSNNEDRCINLHAQNIMSIAGNIFTSLLQDMLIAANVRNWLHRLEIPLLKLAIVDESLFQDKNHAARQVVNKLSKFELYENTGSATGESAICRKINSLLDKITDETALDINVYEHISQELGFLINIQDEAYNDNLNDLRNACEEEQKILTAQDDQYTPKTDESLPPTSMISEAQRQQAPGIAIQDNQQHWINKVHRINLGDWLLFNNDSYDSQRLRLAWISKKHDRYVFVNLRGLRECTLTHLELAGQLRDNVVIPLDNADDPALDRSQYTMIQDLHKQLLHESSHDQLTGLLNRRNFENHLRVMLNDDENLLARNTLCHLKIGQFNIVNTACGYEGGDKLLTEIAEKLKNRIQQDALLARLGSSKFGILLKNCPLENAQHITQQFLNEIQNTRFCYGEKEFPLSFSIGLVAVEDHKTITTLLQAGESSCKLAEEKGNNYIQVFREDDQELSQQQNSIYWLERVNDALENGKLAVRCQPIVPITTDGYGAPHHSEVLLCMTDDNGNPVSPEEFILAAEHYNKMPEVDKWVINHVFQWMKDHQDSLSSMGSFAINLSGRSLNDSGFRDFILEACSKTGISMERICFEVTETAGITNLSSAADFILKLKETGCSFSLDDFGSGMSSYGYLKNLPVDYLKIDGVFVREMDKNPNDFAVVKSICEIGHFMGKKIIAEYVESEAILEQLRSIGVDYAQGYAVGKPSLLKNE